MKLAFAALLVAATSLATAGTVFQSNGAASANAIAHRNSRGLRCTPQQYNCGDYVAEVDLCEDGTYYLRGTDIPFRCQSRW